MGSEMCIRDRLITSPCYFYQTLIIVANSLRSSPRPSGSGSGPNLQKRLIADLRSKITDKLAQDPLRDLRDKTPTPPDLAAPRARHNRTCFGRHQKLEHADRSNRAEAAVLVRCRSSDCRVITSNPGAGMRIQFAGIENHLTGFQLRDKKC